MTRYSVLATALVWAAVLTGCGTIETQTDTLDRLKRCTSKEGPLDGYCGTGRTATRRPAGAFVLRWSYCGARDVDLHLTRPIAMDDLNQVRESLGYGRINLFGSSYDTRAAIANARRHPESVRSVVLDSVAAPDMVLSLYFAQDSQRAFDQLTAAYAADAGCAAAFQTSRIASSSCWHLDRKLERRPKRVTVAHPRTGKPEEVTFDRLTISGIVFGALYLPETAAMLPLLIHGATEGDANGGADLQWLAVVLPAGLLAPAIELYLASFARTFKEAQQYMGYVIMLPMLAMMGSMAFSSEKVILGR